MYGTAKISKGTLADSLKQSWADIKKSGAEVGQQMSDLGSDVATFRTMPKNLKDTADSLPVLPTMPADNVMTTDISKMIDTYIYDVFVSQKTDLDLVSMSEVRGVTPAFAVLGKQVSVLKNDILGGKDKKNSLMGSL
ncbi:MAG: hypothetical protein WCL18_10620 [bacterium]